jgi:subtilisin
MRLDEPHSDIFEAIARRALRRGTVIVAAAGNQSSRVDGVIAPIGSPANCPSVVGVGAVDETLEVADFSNGAVGQYGAIDIAAPGVNIISSYSSKEHGQGYGTWSGTSFATPHVAGVLALLAEAYPNALGTTLVKDLKQGARRLDGTPTDVGVGMVQAP